MENFLAEVKNNIVIDTVNLVRATLEQAEEFKKIIQNHIAKNELNIIVDLTKCEFVDSTFLSTLITSLKKVAANGGNLKLVTAQNDVNLMLESTGMFRVFDIYESVEDAVNSYNQTDKS